MATSLSQLKKSRDSQFEKLLSAAEKTKQGTQQKSGADERFWKPTVDKAGNGSAIIRFLPPPPNEDVPFVRYWDHGFQGPGGWYIEKSLTTFNEDDPVSQYNSKLWNSGIDSNKELARKQKRRLHHVSNVFVLSDPGNPSNEGKVFLYEFGKKIYDMLEDLMYPQFEDEDRVNPFDLWEGANFRLRIRQVEGYRNYDKSSFDSQSQLNDSDEVMEQIWQTQHSLSELIDRKNFKSYDQLAARLEKVLGNQAPTTTAESAMNDPVPQEKAWTPPAEPVASSPQVAPAPAKSSSFDDDDEALDFFKSLQDS